MKPKAILWDMDGTLINSEPAHKEALVNALTSLGKTAPLDIHDKLLGASFVEVHKVVLEVTGLTLSLDEWNSLKWQHYQACSTDIQLLSGRTKILNECKTLGIPMALVSNSTRNEVDLNLKVCNLNDFFEVTISRNDVTNGKPAPDGYLAAAKTISMSPEVCLVIEDSVTGARSGLAANMMTLFHPETEALCVKCPEGAILLPPQADLATWLSKTLTG